MLRPDAARAAGNARNRLFYRRIRAHARAPAPPYQSLIPPPVFGKATLTILAFDSADMARLFRLISKTKI
jgi:hypothetical protein